MIDATVSRARMRRLARPGRSGAADPAADAAERLFAPEDRKWHERLERNARLRGTRTRKRASAPEEEPEEPGTGPKSA